LALPTFNVVGQPREELSEPPLIGPPWIRVRYFDMRFAVLAVRISAADFSGCGKPRLTVAGGVIC